MGAGLTKFCAGETDINDNGVPDNKELMEFLEKHIDSLTTMGKKKIIKIINYKKFKAKLGRFFKKLIWGGI
jgi:hypothetical protein